MTDLHEAMPSATYSQFNFFLKPVFKVCSFLGVFFLCGINPDNYVLLVSSVDLLKMKFTISLSEL